MPKILVNYKYNKKTDTYTLLSNDYVFADMPIAIAEIGVEYENPLIVPVNGKSFVFEKEEYLKANKQFKLIANEDGSVMEDDNGTLVWLPISTDITKLRFINGQLLLVEEEENK